MNVKFNYIVQALIIDVYYDRLSRSYYTIIVYIYINCLNESETHTPLLHE
jgi:hypothetical protein